jgi:hypothetical protein
MEKASKVYVWGLGFGKVGTKRGNGRHAWIGTIQGADRQGAEEAWVERVERCAVDLPAAGSKRSLFRPILGLAKSRVTTVRRAPRHTYCNQAACPADTGTGRRSARTRRRTASQTREASCTSSAWIHRLECAHGRHVGIHVNDAPVASAHTFFNMLGLNTRLTNGSAFSAYVWCRRCSPQGCRW